MVPMTFHILIVLIATCIINCDGARARVNIDELKPKTMFESYKSNITVHKREENTNSSLPINEWSSDGKPEFAGITGVSGHGYVVGANAIIAIYAPRTVAAGQSSTAFISVDITKDDVYHQIQVGWAVSPAFYNDMDIHFYLYHWDSKGTSCQDYNCKDFQPANIKDINLKFGDKLTPSSVGAPEQSLLKVFLAYEYGGLSWCVVVNDQRIGCYGFLPEASSARFGGEAYTPPGWHTSPPMGSGSMTAGMKSMTAYFQNVQIDGDVPQNAQKVETRCYYVADEGSPKWFDGYGFFFGGTGGHDKGDCNY